jgi:hypothetical protein
MKEQLTGQNQCKVWEAAVKASIEQAPANTENSAPPSTHHMPNQQ